MEAANPFAQMPITPEPIIAQVRRQLADDAPHRMTVEATVLDAVVDHAVRELWESRVKTFVPVLALRQAREVLRDQDLVIAMQHPESRLSDAVRTAQPQEERPGRDVLPIPGDVLTHDERDVLRL